MRDYTFTLIVIILMIWITAFAVLRGFDKVLENQDIMLCESAKVSGNVQYLHKCACYYGTEDIKCLQK